MVARLRGLRYPIISMACRLAAKLEDRAVLSYIKNNPGRRLFEINNATLKSHHSWATKSVVSRLERRQAIYVVRKVDGQAVKPIYYDWHCDFDTIQATISDAVPTGRIG